MFTKTPNAKMAKFFPTASPRIPLGDEQGKPRGQFQISVAEAREDPSFKSPWS